MASRTSRAYLEDSPRVILVIGDAAIAHPPLSHDRRVEAGVREGPVAAAMGLASSNELADGGIPPVLFLDLADLAASHVQVGATSCKGNKGEEANDYTCGDGGLIRRVGHGR